MNAHEADDLAAIRANAFSRISDKDNRAILIVQLRGEFMVALASINGAAALNRLAPIVYYRFEPADGDNCLSHRA